MQKLNFPDLKIQFKKDHLIASFTEDGAACRQVISYDELGKELDESYDSANGLYVPILKTDRERDDNGVWHSYVEPHDVWISVVDYIAEAIEGNAEGRPDELKEIYNAVDSIIERILTSEIA